MNFIRKIKTYFFRSSDKLCRYLLIIFFICFLVSNLFAQEKNPSKLAFGLEIGRWVPTELNSDPDLSSLKEIKQKPYLGVVLLKPWKFGLNLRTNAGFWRYEEMLPEKKGIRVVSFLLDLKYTLISDVLVLPYVSYGVGCFIGFESEKNEDIFETEKQSELGIGINIGAGFDFRVTQRVALTAEFRYHYIKFQNVIVFTDNYSGPKLSVGLLYFL